MVFPSGVNADLQQWRDDALIECHNNDALWGYAVWVFEHIRLYTANQWDDLVLLHLVQMGSLDWVHPDFCSNQLTQGIQFATAMGSRLYERIRVMEWEVCWRCWAWSYADNDAVDSSGGLRAGEDEAPQEDLRRFQEGLSIDGWCP